jgi:hypothetical protein
MKFDSKRAWLLNVMGATVAVEQLNAPVDTFPFYFRNMWVGGCRVQVVVSSAQGLWATTPGDGTETECQSTTITNVG